MAWECVAHGAEYVEGCSGCETAISFTAEPKPPRPKPQGWLRRFFRVKNLKHPMWWVAFVVYVGLPVLILWGLGMTAAESTIRARCLARGYPNGTLSADLTAYCGRRVNQTDEVIPLGKLR